MLKVSSKSNPTKVAGAIASMIRENEKISIQTIGAGSLNQAVKSVAIARGYLVPTGINIVMVPSFGEVLIDNLVKTTIKLDIEAI